MRRLVSVTGVFGLVLLATGPAVAQLRVGVATVDITPPAGVRMYGYGARGPNVSTGVHDPLYAKAIVLSDGERTTAWVTMDLGYADKPLTRDVRASVSATLAVDDVFLSSSHTHSGPAFVQDFPSTAQPWVEDLRRKVTMAIVEAHGSLVPARLGVGWGQVDVGHNRRRVRADTRPQPQPHHLDFLLRPQVVVGNALRAVLQLLDPEIV